ncbi:hypothetical protein [Massilia aerilata]|uniref:Uncharacterized protein n=1 Tax=Massilia aerilata TaxID=453817 RepID=A0ABW0RYM9_9BURK
MKQFGALPALACALAWMWTPHGAAQNQAPATQAAAPLTVKVSESKQFGELPYRPVIESFRLLQSYQPAEPRLVDVLVRAKYPFMSDAEQDAYMPQRWGVAIVSPSVDLNVPVRRGGYFVLPDVDGAYREKGSILFREPTTRPLYLYFSLRVGAGQRIRYADLGKASEQIDTLLGKISYFNRQLRHLKRDKHDAIKACFLDASGDILIDGKSVADGSIGNCKLLRIDPERMKSGDVIEFSGPLDIVTFAESGQQADPA